MMRAERRAVVNQVLTMARNSAAKQAVPGDQESGSRRTGTAARVWGQGQDHGTTTDTR
jgi:hypothetical protein